MFEVVSRYNPWELHTPPWRGAYSFVVCLSHLTIDHAPFLLLTKTSYISALMTCFSCNLLNVWSFSQHRLWVKVGSRMWTLRFVFSIRTFFGHFTLWLLLYHQHIRFALLCRPCALRDVTMFQFVTFCRVVVAVRLSYHALLAVGVWGVQ